MSRGSRRRVSSDNARGTPFVSPESARLPSGVDILTNRATIALTPAPASGPVRRRYSPENSES